MARQKRGGETLGADLEALRELSREELKRAWQDLYGSTCPAHLSRILLRRALAYRMQEQALGGSARPMRVTARFATG